MNLTYLLTYLLYIVLSFVLLFDGHRGIAPAPIFCFALLCKHRTTETVMTDGDWHVEGVPADRNEKRYDCCPEVYIDITFTVQIQRRRLYYIFNLVVPCFMMSCLSLLVFSMPPDAGEKITCGMCACLLRSIANRGEGEGGRGHSGQAIKLFQAPRKISFTFHFFDTSFSSLVM